MAADPEPPNAAELAHRLAGVEEQLDELRALLSRAYEQTQAAAAEVLRARRDPAHAEAYEGDPLVSVRIGAYRGGDLLFERALASVQAQTHANLECIVVCDGRDAETAARIAALGDPRLRCLQRPRNGPYPAEDRKRWLVAGTHPFNQAVAHARGAWIAPIDQDDEWTPDHLETLLAAARESRAEVVYGVSRVVLDDGTETFFGSWPPKLGDFGFQAAIYHAGLATLLYDANSHLVGEPADWNLARRMLEAGVSFEFVERVVAAYYIGSDDPVFSVWKDKQQQLGAFAPGGN
jgi:glycosyltransferase involved in cell wall biosynthesis